MASLQCNKPANDTCQQKSNTNGNHSGLGQKVAEMASWVTGKHQDSQHTTAQAHCHSVTQAQLHPDHATSKTETHCDSQTKTSTNHNGGGHGMAKLTGHTSGHGHKATNGGVAAAGCGGNTKTKKKGEHKNSLLHKIMDKVSGNSSCSDSSSSSDGESDNEGCPKRKN
ncbi:uncharacterized protein LOC21395282 [Morus notabilis]|uniref:uncharacterized protein LOC21395282 n=1 Tax=Morus notabilis TaxID=981085 RepID=UPI000CED34A3|nr:uncharacterized protein LOC21395282 [Morus notabilis]